MSAALLRLLGEDATDSKAVSGVALLAADCSKSSIAAFLADAEEAFGAVFGVLFAVLVVLGFFPSLY